MSSGHAPAGFLVQVHVRGWVPRLGAHHRSRRALERRVLVAAERPSRLVAYLRGQPAPLRWSRLRPLPPDSAERAGICEVLVERYAHLVRACVRPYRASPEPAEDLMQVGYLGLIKAIGNFDPGVGDSLPAYAAPCVSGEIKRHFRDKRWQVHVRRLLQELLLEIRAVSGELAQERGRAPADDELAGLLGVTEDDEAVEHAIDMEAVRSHLDDLPEREQRILNLRFYGNLTQAEIGQRLGISQMHVSRLLARALGYLRHQLTGEPGHGPAAARGLSPDLGSH